MDIAQFLTDFADQALVLPLALCVLIGLVLARWRRGALAWAFAVGGVLGVMLLLKLLFAACTLGRVRSPSGHTAAAIMVYGGIAALLLRQATRQRAAVALTALVAVTIAAAIGATRLILGAHSPAEVLVGALVGSLGVALLLLAAGPPPPLRTGRIALVALILILALHGTRLAAEPLIDRIAALYFAKFSVCAGAQVRS